MVDTNVCKTTSEENNMVVTNLPEYKNRAAHVKKRHVTPKQVSNARFMKDYIIVTAVMNTYICMYWHIIPCQFF